MSKLYKLYKDLLTPRKNKFTTFSEKFTTFLGLKSSNIFEILGKDVFDSFFECLGKKTFFQLLSNNKKKKKFEDIDNLLSLIRRSQLFIVNN